MHFHVVYYREDGIMARADPASFTSRHGLTKLLGGDRPVTIT